MPGRTMIIIRYVNVVGMRHYSNEKELPLEDIFIVMQEPENKYDTKALRVVDVQHGRTKAYIMRQYRDLIRPIFEKDWATRVYIRANFLQ